MIRDPLTECVAIAGFECAEREVEAQAKAQGNVRRARTWSQATELDRIWWRRVVVQGAVSPQDVYETRLEGAYGITPWSALPWRRQLMWKRIANAMNEARRRAMGSPMAAD